MRRTVACLGKASDICFGVVSVSDCEDSASGGESVICVIAVCQVGMKT